MKSTWDHVDHSSRDTCSGRLPSAPFITVFVPTCTFLQLKGLEASRIFYTRTLLECLPRTSGIYFPSGGRKEGCRARYSQKWLIGVKRSAGGRGRVLSSAIMTVICKANDLEPKLRMAHAHCSHWLVSDSASTFEHVHVLLSMGSKIAEPVGCMKGSFRWAGCHQAAPVINGWPADSCSSRSKCS